MAALPEGQQFFTVDQVAEILLCNRRTVLNLLARKQLLGFRLGRSWRIKREDLEEFTATKDVCADEPPPTCEPDVC